MLRSLRYGGGSAFACGGRPYGVKEAHAAESTYIQSSATERPDPLRKILQTDGNGPRNTPSSGLRISGGGGA